MSVKVIAAKGEQEKKIAYKLRYDVMCKKLDWLPPDKYPDAMEHDKYDQKQSLIFLAMEMSGKCVGTSRLIYPGKYLLPIETHFKTYSKEFLERIYGKLSYCVEGSRFIVPDNSNMKNHEITMMLYRAMIIACIKIGVSHMYVSADYRVFRLLKILGVPLSEIGDAEVFMGSKTVPCIIPIGNLLAKTKRIKPELYNYLTSPEEWNDIVAAA